MALMIPLAIATYSYYKHRESFNGEPEFELEGKTALELLPSEREHFLISVPQSTVTFFDGNAKQAAEIIKKRVDGILDKSPWLGGRLHVEGGELKLWYDETGKDRAPNIFRLVESTSEVTLSRDTPYAEYSEALSDSFVRLVNDIVEKKDEPIWKVTLIPDAKEPQTRFALVFSMSRVAGDPYTLNKVYSMLSTDKPFVKLNPVRKQDFMSAAEEVMGKEEASYLKNVSSNPLWELVQTEKPHVHVFYISEQWVKQQKLLLKLKMNARSWTWVNRAKQKVTARTNKCCWGILPESFSQSAVQDVEEAVSDSDDISDSSFTVHEMIVSWFWRTIDAKIALMGCNMRNSLVGLAMEDAGNYQGYIPLTPNDFATPELVHKSRIRARRVGADRQNKQTILPKLSWDTTFSFANDAMIEFSEIKGIGKQVLHLPFVSSNLVHALPKTLSAFQVFTAGEDGKLGAMVLATPSVQEVIESCGIVKETIAKF